MKIRLPVFFWLSLYLVLFSRPAKAQVTLVVTGDVMLARSVTAAMRQRGDFGYLFGQVHSLLGDADLAWINLESPFGLECPTTHQGMNFCADYRAVEGLVGSGVDLVSLANNHVLDQGANGLEATKQLLIQNLLQPTGLDEPVMIEKKGVRLGFLNYNAVVPRSELVSWAEPELIREEVARLREKVDVIVVFFHWGEEYTPQPERGGGSKYSPRQLAYEVVEAGADLVLGAHPHVVQPPEWYQGKLIVYSFGNFIFDQTWSVETQRGMVGRFVLDKEGLMVATYLPIKIVDFQPRVVGGLDNIWPGF